MEFQYLKYFVSVSEKLNFSEAARVCHVSQPSLSIQIRKMEDQLGGALFLRNKRSVALTPAGRALYPIAKRILDDIASLGSTAQRLADPWSRHLMIGVTSSTAQSNAFSNLRRLSGRHPGLKYRFFEDSSAQLVRGLNEQKYDLIMLPETPALTKGPFLIAIVDEDELLTCTSSNLPSSSFRSLPLISTYEGCGLRPLMERAATTHQKSISHDLLAHHTDMIKRWVQLGMGWALLPSRTLNSADRKAIRATPLSPRFKFSYWAVAKAGLGHEAMIHELSPQ